MATQIGHVDSATARKAVTVGAIGNFIEWYDFAVYGFFATIIAGQFFPSEDRVASLLATFAVFAVSFFMRPVGAFVFGHYGDRVGRRNTLAVAVILMGIATLMIGVLPTYGQVGVLAPILLVVARLLQGFSAGGEWSGSAAFMVEYAPESRRGLYGSWQQFSIVAGLLVGSAIGALLGAVMPEDALNAWGWRIPFILGILVGVVGLYLRLRLEDTPAFRAVEQKNEVASAPIKESFTSHGGESVTAIGFTVGWTVSYYILLTYMPTYVSETLGIPLATALFSNAVGLIVLVAPIPFTGALSDRIGRKPLLIAFWALIALLTYPLFLLVSTGSLFLIVLGQVLFGLIISLFSGPGPAVLVEMFPSPAPAATSRPGIYLIVAALITLVFVSRIRETSKEPLRET